MDVDYQIFLPIMEHPLDQLYRKYMMNGYITEEDVERLKQIKMKSIETYRLVGSLHLLPFVSVCYDSTICEKSITIGWLWWGIALVKKDSMHL